MEEIPQRCWISATRDLGLKTIASVGSTITLHLHCMDEPRIPFDVVRNLMWVLTEVSCRIAAEE